MEHFIGIDLGTTYSAVSTIDEYGKPIILKNCDGEHLTPSVVYFDDHGNAIAGAEAKEMMLSGEDNVIMFFKREMGNPEFCFNVNGKDYSATDLSAILLRKLKSDAEISLGSTVSKAVITVPAYFNDLQRNETIKAAQNAGLEVLRIINEPTAAAINYGITRDVDQKLLVYDLGGGTFDVTVLEVKDGGINVLATGGDHSLGGKDWDDCIINYITDQFVREFGEDPNDDPLTYNDLAFNAEKLKKQLSSTQSASMLVRYAGHRQKYEITREKFEELTANLLQSTQEKTEEVLREAGLSWHDISGALLVGGSTKMPMVEKWVQEMSGRAPLRGINVDEAVCLGAGIQASLEMANLSVRRGLPQGTFRKLSLPSGKNLQIKDVMSHSLGVIAVSDDRTQYVNSIIIEKNKTIPISAKRSFCHRTFSNSTNDLEIYLTQGESTDVHDVLVVSKYVLKGIQYVPGNVTNIDIEYSYNEDGVINVSGYQTETSIKLVAEKAGLPQNMMWLFERPKSLALPYSKYAGQSLIPGVKTDVFGNPLGSEYDLAKDGAFEGYKIVIVDLCSDSGTNMHEPSKALQKKGFSVVVYKGKFPLKEIKNILDDCKSQLWLIADRRTHLSNEHYTFIYELFNSGKGLYLWSDNDPYFADTNPILSKLFNSKMRGDYHGDKVLSIQKKDKGPGIIKDHLITTGVQNFYEGITISNVRIDGGLSPLVYSSDGLIVTAYYDLDGKRCLVDGGFTRLYYKWNSAGTDRFVVNCAAWLANLERFGYYPEKSDTETCNAIRV
ncbi:Hsp70 family protein [Prevotellamassilia timonensis]|uniref:Hsp70 family protein n=1 Tax=Prevotellamassilia timonensis TaxID=1852370 RepID=UPI001F4908A4|nr:Hsp70 family protein [Prevotellamassilia timonensis]MCF2635376.1 Hsp70 family protein [Prevotellamassilia timonensis]